MKTGVTLDNYFRVFYENKSHFSVTLSSSFDKWRQNKNKCSKIKNKIIAIGVKKNMKRNKPANKTIPQPIITMLIINILLLTSITQPSIQADKKYRMPPINAEAYINIIKLLGKSIYIAFFVSMFKNLVMFLIRKITKKKHSILTRNHILKPFNLIKLILIQNNKKINTKDKK
ncbi:hypothetical protein [Helicobacter sp. 13S00477-4]|uniref:hypothetical protein n=1 Tax=Helicobacter sp. 13S00477-4 TaxID=1905759 RepID=UPI000BA73456|nr:hypothetical protein [Helicobacter sp. 13S00477-4]PAF50860.1 hypothetical protein BKH44_06845 [Helicobacter sp. 13S00477-4]